MIALLVVTAHASIDAQEKKIPFNKGVLKIESSKNFIIKGYNGNEVIIKSLHKNKLRQSSFTRSSSQGFSYQVNGKANNSQTAAVIAPAHTDSVRTRKGFGQLYFSHQDQDRKKGLKKLGKKEENKEFGIYFTIEQKDGELIFKDNNQGLFVMHSDESYEIMIPNSIKLNWNTSGSSGQTVFYSHKASSLSDFNGEVEISSSLNNLKLNDVIGPVSINTIGGNVTITFDKKTPKQLYSIYSNNGFIDITLPTTSDIVVDANASSIYSDIDFKVLEEKEKLGMQEMKLKLKSGRVKLKLNAGLGSIYLRKK